MEEKNGTESDRQSVSTISNGDNESIAKSDLQEGSVDSQAIVIPRTIGLLGGISFIVGTIIGSGIFVSPRGIAEGSGSVGLTMINWVICGFISLLGAFCYAELGTVIKDSGADYSYLHYGYGPIISYMFSWVNNILVKPASLSLITLTCAEYIIVPLFDDGCGPAPEYIKKMLAVVVLFILAAVNVYSLKLAQRVQIIFTFSKIIALAIIIIGGIVKLAEGNTQYLSTGFTNTETNPGTIAVGLYSGFWAYDGWNTANFMTEEIINPKRNLPLAICIGMPLVIIAYVLTNISYFSVMSIEEMISSPAVAITWAERVIPSVAWIIPIFVALSTFGTGNGSLFSGGRLMYAAARNEHMPGVISMVHVEKYTPVPAIALSILLAIIFLLPGNIGALIDFVSFLQWIFYGMAFLTVVIFRYRKKYKDLDRSFKVPLFIPIIAFVFAIFLVVVPIITDPRIEFLFAVILIVVGYLVYIPMVHFKVRFGFMKPVTKFFQLYLMSVKPTKVSLE
jgi:L-type amino acid transporter 9